MAARFVLLVVGFAGAAVLVSSFGCEAPSTGDSHPLVGRKAPLFNSTMLDESPFDLAEHVGRDVVILDFWATWCGPCRQALPTLSEVAAQYKSRGVEFFAVDCGESADEVQRFLDESGLNLAVVMDRDGAIGELYHVEAIPQTVIIGKDGTVQTVHIGTSPDLKARLTQELDELVGGEQTAGVSGGPARLASRAGAEP